MSLRVKLDSLATATEMTLLAAWEKLETGIVYNPTKADHQRDPFRLYRKLHSASALNSSAPSTGAVPPAAGSSRATATCWPCCGTRPSPRTSATGAATRA